MKTFVQLRQELIDEAAPKGEKNKQLKKDVDRRKGIEVYYYEEKPKSKKVRVYVKQKEAKEPSELGVYRDMSQAQKSVKQFIKLMGEDISEGLQLIKDLQRESKQTQLQEKRELDQKVINKIEKFTDRNDHNASVLLLARTLKNKTAIKLMNNIIAIHKIRNDMSGLIQVRREILDDLLDIAKREYSNYDDIYGSF
tara:strand:+ start:10516 stop:11103 length:588 start_codon:yes stop_codon:yes gene_type:complete